MNFLYLQDELKNELEELEQEQLNERLIGAERAPVHAPAVASSSRVTQREGESFHVPAPCPIRSMRSSGMGG